MLWSLLSKSIGRGFWLCWLRCCVPPLLNLPWLAQVGWIPAEYRRPGMIALGSVFLYWLFLGGSRAPVPAPSPENYPPMDDGTAGVDDFDVEYVDEDEWGE